MGMSWNYRIFRHRHKKSNTYEKCTTYALHEAYYNNKGRVDGWTVEPMTPHRDSPSELLEMLIIMLRDTTKSYGDILEYEPKRTTTKTRKNEKRKAKKSRSANVSKGPGRAKAHVG